MARKKAIDLEAGDDFADPYRDGRPARVEQRHSDDEDGRVFVTLDDATGYGPWVASYESNEELVWRERRRPTRNGSDRTT